MIESPPVDRLAIRTYVTKADDHVIREAILLHLDGLREDGLPIPMPTTEATRIDVPA